MRFGHRGEARERRPVRASALNFTTARTRRRAPRGARVGPRSPQSNPCSPSVYISPCGATGAMRAAIVGVADAGATPDAEQRRSISLYI